MKKILKRGIALLLCLTMIFNYSFSTLADDNVESSEPETTYTESIEYNESTEEAEVEEEVETEETEEEESVEEDASENGIEEAAATEEDIDIEENEEDLINDIEINGPQSNEPGEEPEEVYEEELEEDAVDDIYEEEPEEDLLEEVEEAEETAIEEPEEDIEDNQVAGEEAIEENTEDEPEEIEEADISSPSEIIDEPEEEENDSIPADVVEEPEEDEVIDEPEEEPALLGSIASPSEVEQETEIEEEIEEASPSELEMPMLLGMPLLGDPPASPECKIDTTEYDTLQDAIAAVTNGQTITMIDDVTYGSPITINNGKTFTIDFNDGSTSHTFMWDVTSGSAINQDIFTIGGSSNVTVKNMTFLTGGSDEQGNRIFKVNATGKLTLSNMECNSGDSTRNTPVMNNGGTVIIDGGNITTNVTDTDSITPNGLNPVVQNLGGTTTFTGNGTFTTQYMTGAAWLGNVITTPDPSADPDNNCGTVIIENGTFNGGHILDVNGKGNITINDATYGTGSGPIIKTFHGGIKSNITINNITTSATAFAQVLEELQTKINFQNGNVKYTPNCFCFQNSATQQMTSVSIKNGKFGPKTGSTDIHDEIEGFLATGATITAISESGYTYKVETPPPVCKIGSTEYPTLEAALNAVTSGQTITMVDDISYTDGTDFIIDGKTVTIDFDSHKITVSIAGMTTINKLFTVTNSGNLTVDSAEIVLSGMNNTVAPFTVTGAGSKLTLIDMTQASNLDRLLNLDGGTATINGGTFGTNNTATKIFLTNNATLKLTNNPIFNCQGNVINISATSNTDADTFMGNVIVDSGDFNCIGTETTGIIALYGKANVTINGGTFTSSNTNSAPIFVGNAGYKSSVTINNFTSDSPYVFRSNNNSNIESFTATINNGHFKYTKGKFAVDSSNSLKPNIRLKGGFYGPDVPDTDAFNELNDLCISGSEIQTLTSSDPEYANGYSYKIYSNSPAPNPHHGGGSGGGGGGAGSPKYDLEGNILGPTAIQNYIYDGTNPPNLSGNITVSHWDYNTKNAQAADIHYVQNIDSFVRGSNTPVATEWVGISTNINSRVLWYRTNASGQILKNQFIELGGNIYYFDNNGIMVTGTHTISGKTLHFDATPGITEGRFLY